MKKILALDISTTSTGYALYQIHNLKNGERIYLKNHGHIDGNGKLAKDRFVLLVRDIKNLLININPDTVVIEAAFFRTSFKSIEYLLKIQGCIEEYCKSYGIDFFTIETTTWRSALGFPTNLKRVKEKPDYKALSIAFAERLTGIEINSDDEADAICIGLGFYHRINMDIKTKNKKTKRRKKK